MFFRHRVLVFREQDLDAEHQIAFMSLINKVITDPELPVLESAAIPLNERHSWMSNSDKGTYGASNNEYCFDAAPLR